MITIKKASLLAATCLMLAPAAAFAAEVKDVVHDARGNVVTSTNGNCVLTQWDAKSNDCGQKVVGGLTQEQRTVYFDFNKSTLNGKEKSKLAEVSKILNGSKEVESVDIVGYADSIGKDSYNKALSTRRAQTVKSYLASKGLKTRKVRVDGQGSTNSVTKCDPNLDRQSLIACLAADRRVEIEVNLKK